MRLHPDRVRRTANLSRLDPGADWHEIYRRLVLWELPAEARFGFQLAFYRPFAVPRMAAILHRSGHFRRDTTRRAYDTGLVMHEIIWGGVDSERGRRMVKLMNAVHRRPDIRPEDMSYVLNALIVVPTRFMDRHGWRKVTAGERAATCRFYDVLGERMGIADRPTCYEDAVEQFNRFEAAQLAPSPEGADLTDAVLAAVRDRLPGLARPFGPAITSALVDDPRVSWALSLPAPSLVFRQLVDFGSRARRTVEQRLPPTTRPSFWPGMPAGAIYPTGYQLHQLGPQAH